MNKQIPKINTQLRSHTILVPEVYREATGVLINGKRIKSLVFSTDVGIFNLKIKASIPKQDAITSGFLIIPIDIFLKSSLPPLKVSNASTDRILNSGTIIAIKRAATPTFSLPNKDSVIGRPNITKLLLNKP